MRLTWRREPSETGLARVIQGARGAILKCDGEDVAHVSALRSWERYGEYVGWYYYGSSERLGIPHANTCRAPVATMDQAKVACEAYVRKHLGKEAK